MIDSKSSQYKIVGEENETELGSTALKEASEEQLGMLCLQDHLEPEEGENSAGVAMNEIRNVFREEKRKILISMRHKTIISVIFSALDKIVDVFLQLSIPQLGEEGEFRGHTPLMPLSAMLTTILLTRGNAILPRMEFFLIWRKYRSVFSGGRSSCSLLRLQSLSTRRTQNLAAVGHPRAQHRVRNTVAVDGCRSDCGPHRGRDWSLVHIGCQPNESSNPRRFSYGHWQLARRFLQQY